MIESSIFIFLAILGKQLSSIFHLIKLTNCWVHIMPFLKRNIIIKIVKFVTAWSRVNSLPSHSTFNICNRNYLGLTKKTTSVSINSGMSKHHMNVVI